MFGRHVMSVDDILDRDRDTTEHSRALLQVGRGRSSTRGLWRQIGPGAHLRLAFGNAIEAGVEMGGGGEGAVCDFLPRRFGIMPINAFGIHRLLPAPSAGLLRSEMMLATALPNCAERFAQSRIVGKTLPSSVAGSY